MTHCSHPVSGRARTGRTRRDRHLRARRNGRPGRRRRWSKSAHGAAGKTLTWHYYGEMVGFVTGAPTGAWRSSRRPLPRPATSSRSPSSATRARTRATPRSRARRAYTVCHFKSAKGAPTCEGVLAIGGTQLLIFRTEPGGDPSSLEAPAAMPGATGGVKMTVVPNTNNSDVVVTVNLKK